LILKYVKGSGCGLTLGITWYLPGATDKNTNNLNGGIQEKNVYMRILITFHKPCNHNEIHKFETRMITSSRAPFIYGKVIPLSSHSILNIKELEICTEHNTIWMAYLKVGFNLIAVSRKTRN
jgi:hypothetical protein